MFGEGMTQSRIQLTITGTVIAVAILIDPFAVMSDTHSSLHGFAETWMILNLPALIISFFVPIGAAPSHGGPIHETWNWFGFLIGQCIEWGLLGGLLSLPIAYLIMRLGGRR